MLKIARAITQFNIVVGKWVSLAILAIFGLLLIDVVMRYLVGMPTIWTSELATLIFGVYGVLGGAFLIADRGHVNVDIYYGNFSARRKALTDIFTWPLLLLFAGTLLWQSFVFATDSIADQERSNSVWGIPLWPVKAIILIAAVMLLLQGIIRLWSDIRVFRGLPAPEDIFGKAAPRSIRTAPDRGDR